MNNLNNNLNNNQSANESVICAKKYATARYNLLLVVAFTVINIVLLLVNSDTMLLFSATVPYISALFAQSVAATTDISAVLVFDRFAVPVNIFITILVGITVLSIAAYLICWFLSKKHYGWMIVALVLFVLDTLAMGGLYILSGDFSGILDAAIHVWVLYYLIMGVSNGHKLKNMPEELVAEAQTKIDADVTEQVADAQAPTSEDFAANSMPLRIADVDVKARILCEGDAFGHHITYRRVKRINELVIDGNVYDDVEMLVESAHALNARIDGNVYQAGYDGGTKSYIRVNGETIAKKTRLW